MRLAKITITICLMLLSASATTYGQGVVKRQQQSKPATQGSTGTVKKNPQVTVTSGEYVDLGLPSGTLWATKNIGANKPEEYGDYFAWGETKEKTNSKWSNYIHCDGTKETCHNIGNDISGTKYDVAHVKWGGNWQIPTIEQFVELYMCCEGKWTAIKGVKGYKLTSEINGNSIFFPATLDSGFDRFGSYWLSTLYPDDSSRASVFYFDEYDADSKSSSRCFGLSVRPVLKLK